MDLRVNNHIISNSSISSLKFITFFGDHESNCGSQRLVGVHVHLPSLCNNNIFSWALS